MKTTCSLPELCKCNWQTHLQPKLSPNSLLRKLLRLCPQHLRSFFQRHLYLLLSDGDQTFGEVQVILLEEFDGHHDVVYVFED